MIRRSYLLRVLATAQPMESTMSRIKTPFDGPARFCLNFSTSHFSIMRNRRTRDPERCPKSSSHVFACSTYEVDKMGSLISSRHSLATCAVQSKHLLCFQLAWRALFKLRSSGLIHHVVGWLLMTIHRMEHGSIYLPNTFRGTALQ